MMLRTISQLAALALLGPLLTAQAVGTPGVNDLTINGGGSGSTSATVIPIAGPMSVLSIDFDCSPSATLAALDFSTSAAAPGAATLPAVGGCLLTPNTYDLDPNTVFTQLVVTLDPMAPELFLLFDSTALVGMTYSVQGFVLDDPCGGGNAIATQAYNVQF